MTLYLRNNHDVGSSFDFAAITPDDSTDLANETRGIYVGGTGDIVVHDKAGNNVTFSSAQAGTVLPIRTKRVLSTSTTATNLVALF